MKIGPLEIRTAGSAWKDELLERRRRRSGRVLIYELREKKGAARQAESQSPARRRRAVRAMRRSFKAAKVDNLFPATAGTPRSINGILVQQLRTLRQRAREEANNNEYVERVHQMVRTNVVGDQGVRLRPDFVDAQGNPDQMDREMVTKEWAEWSRRGNCDVTGKLSLVDVQNLFIESWFRDGEVLVRLVPNWSHNAWGLALQVLDADYLDEHHNEDLGSDGSIVMGIRLDSWGRPLAYHLTKRNAYKDLFHYLASNHDTQAVPADQVIHGFVPRYAEQVRGYPKLFAAFRRIHQLRGVEEAEVIASRIAAEKMGFFTSKTGDDYEGQDEQEDGTLVIESEAGAFEQLPAGVELTPWDPQHPNAQLPDFMKQMLRGYASGVGFNYNTIANDLEGVNYSSLRQGALEDRAVWRCLQQFLVHVLLEPVYRTWLDWSILVGRLPFPPRKIRKYHRVAWEPRGFEWVDPKKEAEADKINYALGATSLTEILARRGRNIEDVLRERQHEQQLAEDMGVAIGGEADASPDPPEGPDE